MLAYDIWVYRDMRHQVACQATSIDVVAAARREADHNGEGLALVEIIRARGCQCSDEARQHEQKLKDAASSFHRHSLIHAEPHSISMSSTKPHITPTPPHR